ncbi:MAG: alpha-amylase/4-alpha-glucanotransferase domain-containing protein [Pirellulaceae bacterium]
MTQSTIRFCLVLHNHQPIGNFDSVFEQSYSDSYRPFLDVFEPYRDLCISLHISGPLMEWLEEHHGDYVDRIAGLVAAGRIEMLGGPFYEPILTMIPSRDRIGQMTAYARWLENRLSADVQGIWIPERVWEPSLTSDLSAAGVRYTVLDDFHFKNAGLTDEKLHGYFLTEDNGEVLRVFPGSERLRYLIPFGQPHETTAYLREIAERHPDSVVVFGDDGEKFGTWPETKKHVYDDGWLRRFFDELTMNGDWIRTTTLADAADNTAPLGKIYLPDASYREMTEWVLPVDQQAAYEDLAREMQHDPRWPQIQRFVRGGFWRNFKVRYPESNEMYARMMMVSRHLEQAEREGVSGEAFERARRELYRGQCNCSYWHGAFGGIYLPHLRNAVYRHLIAADNALQQAVEKTGTWVEATVGDYNFDTRQEVRLVNDKLVSLIAPATGGHLYELDVRSICLNLAATLARRPEAYHRKVRQGAGNGGGDGQCSSIHDRVIFKQEGLEQRLQYDDYPRKSLVDHFYSEDVTQATVARGDADEQGDFAQGTFDTRLRRNPDQIQVVMSREGMASGVPIKITKGLMLAAGASMLEVSYYLENLPQDRALHFGVEFNFSSLPSHADDRFFFQDDPANGIGHLGSHLDLRNIRQLGLADAWLGLTLLWNTNRNTDVWTFPVETVSQSEGGFELVHQSVVVQPHWRVRGDGEGTWSVTMQLAIDTSVAESRHGHFAETNALTT